MATRGTESGNQPKEIVASATNEGGSWNWAENVKARCQGGEGKGYAAFGPVPDPMAEEASNLLFSNIVSMPILPENTADRFPSLYRHWDNAAFGIKNFFNKIVNRKSDTERFYHEVPRRVPGIWECAVNDQACWYEAEMEFIKEREINRQILQILEDRQRMCWLNNQHSHWYDTRKNVDPCAEISAYKRQADMNYATKYKHLHQWGAQAPNCLMKQKNRFIEKRWLERQGKSYEELQNMFHEPLTRDFVLDMMKWG